MKNTRINTEYYKGKYRGIITEIAQEERVSRMAIRQALFLFNNTRIIAIAEAKKKERDLKHSQTPQE